MSILSPISIGITLLSEVQNDIISLGWSVENKSDAYTVSLKRQQLLKDKDFLRKFFYRQIMLLLLYIASFLPSLWFIKFAYHLWNKFIRVSILAHYKKAGTRQLLNSIMRCTNIHINRLIRATPA